MTWRRSSDAVGIPTTKQFSIARACLGYVDGEMFERMG